MAREARDEDASSDEDEELSPWEFAIQLARDLIVAAVIIGIAVGSVFLYTGVWPPMVVVESGSMQHGNSGHLGVIDTGDLVLVQTVNGEESSVITYVEGAATGYETYSNYGDVIVFHPPGTGAGVTPIIHRAILRVVYPSGVPGGGVDAPSLARFPGVWSGTDRNGNLVNRSQPFNLWSVTLQVRSWHTGSEGIASLTINFTGVIRSGFYTKGDHNPSYDPVYDGSGKPPVPASNIIGKARGELPWFGLIKLTLWPTSSGCCRRGWGDAAAPPNSWDSLATSFFVIALGLKLADYGFVFGERYWKSFRGRRKEREGEEEEQPTTEEAEPPDDAAK